MVRLPEGTAENTAPGFRPPQSELVGCTVAADTSSNRDATDPMTRGPVLIRQSIVDT